MKEETDMRPGAKASDFLFNHHSSFTLHPFINVREGTFEYTDHRRGADFRRCR